MRRERLFLLGPGKKCGDKDNEKARCLFRKIFLYLAALKYYCLVFDLTVLINERLDKGK